VVLCDDDGGGGVMIMMVVMVVMFSLGNDGRVLIVRGSHSWLRYTPVFPVG